MSFTVTVKAEIAAKVPAADYCLLAELMALRTAYGQSAPDLKILKKSCCKRAFLRGMFLSAGTLSDPNTVYNLEIACRDSSIADTVLLAMQEFAISGKVTKRRGKYIVYLKDGEQIADFLRVIEADRSVLQMENVRVVKNVRATINRKVNCETSNLHKTSLAGVRQNQDIEWIANHIGFEHLPESLQEIAMLRAEYPEASLAELGEMCHPKIGKSGVNHRLRRLHRIHEERG